MKTTTYRIEYREPSGPWKLHAERTRRSDAIGLYEQFRDFAAVDGGQVEIRVIMISKEIIERYPNDL